MDNTITGNSLSNLLNGDLGNDTLNGAAGADTLSGGAGDDIYVIDNAGDVIIENVDEGIDLVKSGVSFTLGANVDDLTLTGYLAINGTGNELSNMLVGNEANNILAGGIGGDSMYGGLGNDTYLVDDITDVVTEAENSGTDTVKTSASYFLGANVENLTLTGTVAIDGIGNELGNIILGNSANNQMAGGLGDDTYGVDNAGDVVVENVGEGLDTVKATISYTLGANVENLTLTGTANIDATGNELNNTLVGNSGTNQLTGGLGDDTYWVANTGDVVVENEGEGIDTVKSSISYTLGANLESLILATGVSALNGTGNSLNNYLTGNSGVNTLNGGVGADTMAGGGSDDTYVVDDVGDVVIENTNAGEDTVQSNFSYTLGANVENLTLTGTANIDATGNELNNTFFGNSGTNQMAGGLGDDIYIINSAVDGG